MSMRWRKLLWMLTALLAGCSNPLRPVVTPLRTLGEMMPGTQGNAHASRLVVMLPGLYDTPEDFIRHGFVEALRERKVDADVLIADTHFGYYENRTVDQRLREDIVLPAKAAGYREIWLLGISLGGLGALIYTAQHPEDIHGVFLIAPYAGPPALTTEIRKAGGPEPWATNGKEPVDENAKLRDFWRWLVTGKNAGRETPRLFFGTGTYDRFVADQNLLASQIPAQHRFSATGGHDWSAWKILWREILDSNPWVNTGRS